MKTLSIIPTLFLLLLAAVSPAFATDLVEARNGQSIVIRRAGDFILRRNLVARSELPVITIAADNVTLDLNGNSLTGLGNKVGEGIVVEGRSNVTVKNGFLSKFGTAVRVSDSNNVDVSDLQISGEDIPGGPPETGILVLNSRGVKVTHNLVSRVFLGIFVRGGASGANTIKGNTISGGENGQLGICYNPAPGADAALDGPTGDLVAENHISRFQTGIQLSPASRSNIFVRNYVNYFALGFEEQAPGTNTIANNQTIELP